MGLGKGFIYIEIRRERFQGGKGLKKQGLFIIGFSVLKQISIADNDDPLPPTHPLFFFFGFFFGNSVLKKKSP